MYQSYPQESTTPSLQRHAVPGRSGDPPGTLCWAADTARHEHATLLHVPIVVHRYGRTPRAASAGLHPHRLPDRGRQSTDAPPQGVWWVKTRPNHAETIRRVGRSPRRRPDVLPVPSGLVYFRSFTSLWMCVVFGCSADTRKGTACSSYRACSVPCRLFIPSPTSPRAQLSQLIELRAVSRGTKSFARATTTTAGKYNQQEGFCRPSRGHADVRGTSSTRPMMILQPSDP